MCIVVLFCWVTFYASCVDAPSFVYCSEIFPTQMRAKGVAASVGALFSVTLSKSPGISSLEFNEPVQDSNMGL